MYQNAGAFNAGVISVPGGGPVPGTGAAMPTMDAAGISSDGSNGVSIV